MSSSPISTSTAQEESLVRALRMLSTSFTTRTSFRMLPTPRPVERQAQARARPSTSIYTTSTHGLSTISQQFRLFPNISGLPKQPRSNPMVSSHHAPMLVRHLVRLNLGLSEAASILMLSLATDWLAQDHLSAPAGL